MTWERAHKAAAIAHLTGVPMSGSVAQSYVGLAPGPILWLDEDARGGGGARHVAESLAATLGRELHDLPATAGTVDPERVVEACHDAEAALLVAASSPRGSADGPGATVGALLARLYFARSRLDRKAVVCGVDGRESSRRALAVAGELADEIGADSIAVHAGLDRTDVDLGADFPSLSLVPKGSPVQALRASASSSGASLIVVGARNAAQARRGAGGSVTRRLAARAPLPVVVVADG